MKRILAVFALSLSALAAEQWRASTVIVRDGVRLCGVCEQPLVRASGFAPRPDVRVDPSHIEALVIAVEEHLFPNHRPWTIVAVSRDGWDVPISFEFCERCDARFEARKREVAADSKVRLELSKRLREMSREQRPNQPPEPTALSVTTRADARVAPASTVAHL